MFSVGPTASKSFHGSRLVLIIAACFALDEVTRAQICFEAPVATPAGNLPISIATADLDGDGDIDVAMADIGSGSVRVFLNDGHGGLAFQAPSTVGWYPWSVTAADLDLDGDVDLVAASEYTNTISVLLNQGNGTFAPEVQYAVNLAPKFVKSADVDGDGLVDLVVTTGTATSVCVLINLGNATFAPFVPYAAGGDLSALELADLDGDGDIDIVTAGYATETVTILLNQGNGTFVPGPQLALYFQATSLASGDVDGDGDVDLVVGQRYTSPLPPVYGGVGVFLNQGNGTFAPQVFYYPSGAPNSVSIADLDGDARPDILVGSNDASVLTAWLNQGNGAFGLPVSIDGGHFVRCVSHADLDADGDEDLVTANQGPEGAGVLRNCRISGSAVCAGDGSGTSCPCGNASAPGSSAGCVNSFSLAGTLRGTGSATLAHDQLVLLGTGVSNSSALYFQGTSAVSGGAGAVFGDGLRCVGGAVRRLGTKVASGHMSQYPGSGDDAVSVKGAVTAPGQRFYQAWYRDAGSFCTTSTFNLTNALSVTWAP